MRKLTDRKILWIIREVENGTHPDEIARFVRVSRRRIYQLKQFYRKEGLIPELKDPNRKKKPLDPEFERFILDAYHIYQSGPVILEKIIKVHYGVAIPHNTIKPHMSLNLDECETPEQAFWRKLSAERILNYSKEWFYAAIE